MYRTRTAAGVLAAAVLAAGAAACSGDDGEVAPAAAPTASEGPVAPTVSMSSMPPGGLPFGSACTAFPASGRGSIPAMGSEPFATAASHGPPLSALAGAIRKAGLADRLDSAKKLTVFAPTDEAFGKVPKATLDGAMADEKKLARILTYHAVARRIAPDRLGEGNFTTLNGAKLKTTGSGDSYVVGDGANVLCGNIHTANATVYVIDRVLMPPE
ncbi:fasciclin domain-containing protein [Actinomadura sp. DSM 109109]|nr:fasciclin domain-containing protein [Actinomadura lepetitiana]